MQGKNFEANRFNSESNRFNSESNKLFLWNPSVEEGRLEQITWIGRQKGRRRGRQKVQRRGRRTLSKMILNIHSIWILSRENNFVCKFQIWHFRKLFSAFRAFERFLSSMRRLKMVTKIKNSDMDDFNTNKNSNFIGNVHVLHCISKFFYHQRHGWVLESLLLLAFCSNCSENFEKVKNKQFCWRKILHLLQNKWKSYIQTESNKLKRNRINWNGIE